MAIDLQAARFLLAARSEGCSFESVVTLGRLALATYPKRLNQLLAEQGLSLGSEPLPTFDGQPVAEPLFKALGARRIESMDISAYQGATVVHDLNQRIPDHLREGFDVVYDGGTLEHVFNFPQAIENTMAMAKVGGRVMLHTPINNFCGHGLYQFSPELFYRMFSSVNGFKVERMVLHGLTPFARWYHVADPAELGDRVELLSLSPILLLVRAQKIHSCDSVRYPAQTDLERVWTDIPETRKKETKNTGGAGHRSQSRQKWNPRFALIARFFQILRNGADFYSRKTLLNRKCFRPTRPGTFSPPQ